MKEYTPLHPQACLFEELSNILFQLLVLYGLLFEEYGHKQHRKNDENDQLHHIQSTGTEQPPGTGSTCKQKKEEQQGGL
ncbi:MAG: hypothetical protein ACOC7U_04090 [Spirochaetota bacterium]